MYNIYEKKADKFFKKAINQLFKSVGFKSFDQSFVDRYKENWFQQKTWDEKTEEKYKKWFISNLMKDLKLNKKRAEKEWLYFNLNYGWKNKK